jgi:hypothetical protein
LLSSAFCALSVTVESTRLNTTNIYVLIFF